MAVLNFTKKAVTDLSKIWKATYKRISENQADTYFNVLISSCQDVSERLHLEEKGHVVCPNVFGIRTLQHLVFYRTINGNEVEIVRIIHDRMALKN